MAISWLLKQRIRINPNIIYRLTEDEVTDEVVDFALSQPRFTLTRYKGYETVGKNEVFARAFLETEKVRPTSSISYLLQYFKEYPEEFRREIIESITSREMSFLSFGNFSGDILSENPKLFIKLLTESNGSLPSVDVNFSAFSQEQIDIIHEMKREKDFKYLPASLKNDDRFLAKALDEDFVRVVNDIDDYQMKDMNYNYALRIKKYFMNNIKNNVASYNLLVRKGITFTDEEKEAILEVTRKEEIEIQKDMPDFVMQDKQTYVTQISKTKDLSIAERFSVSGQTFTDEEKQIVADAILDKPLLSTVRNNRSALQRMHENMPGMMRLVAQKAPIIGDYLNKYYCGYFVSGTEVKYGEYFPSEFTPADYFVSDKSDFLIEALRRDFDSVIKSNVIKYYSKHMTAEEHRQVYLIAQEHGYIPTDDSAYFIKNNPYFVVEFGNRTYKVDYYFGRDFTEEERELYSALQNKKREVKEVEEKKKDYSEIIEYLLDHNIYSVTSGYYLSGEGFSAYSSNIPDAAKIIKSPEFIIRAAQRNIMILTKNPDEEILKGMSREQFKIIFDEYTKFLEHATLSEKEDLDDSSLIRENPYAIMDLYEKKGESFTYTTGEFLTRDEHKKIAEIFWRTKGKKITVSSYGLEKSNPYIVLESIKEDPSTIDLINISDTMLDYEIIRDEIVRCIESGDYELTTSTPTRLLYDNKVLDYILESDNFDLVYLLADKGIFDKERSNAFKTKIIEYVESGKKITDSIPNVFTDNEVLDLLKKDPNLYGYLMPFKLNGTSNDKEENAQFKAEVERIVYEAIENGSLELSVTMFARLRRIPNAIDTLLKQDKSNLLYIDSFDMENISEYRTQIMALLDEGKLKIGKDFHYSALYTMHEGYPDTYDIEPRLTEYILKQNPAAIKGILTEFGRSDSKVVSDIVSIFDKTVDLKTFPIDKNEDLKWLIETPELLSRFIKFDKSILNHPRLVNASVYYTPENAKLIIDALGEDYRLDETTPAFIRNNKTLSRMLSVRDVKLPPPLDMGSSITPPGNIPPPPVSNEDRKKGLFDTYTGYINFDSRMLPRIVEDVRLADKIDPTRRMPGPIIERMVKAALESDYILNENSFLPFRMNPDIIIKSIKEDPRTIEFAVEQSFEDEKRQEILEILLAVEPPIRLNDKSFTFLRRSHDYIKHSLEGATKEEIQIALDSVVLDYNVNYNEKERIKKLIEEYVKDGSYVPSLSADASVFNMVLDNRELFMKCVESNFSMIQYLKGDLLTFTKEEQEKIYELFKAQEDSIKENQDIQEAMKKNSFYVMDYVRENLDKIDEVSFDGLKLTDEFKQMVIKHYLANGIKVSESTPKFVREDSSFVYNYIKNNGGELAGLDVLEVAPLLRFSSLKEHPEYIELSKFYDEYKSGYEVYFEHWGKEKTLEYALYLGDLIKYLDYDIEYDLETITKDFEMLVLNKNDLSSDETVEILTSLNISISKDYFQTHPGFKNNDQIFAKVLETNPTLITEYTGNNERMMQIALENGLEITEELLSTEYIVQSKVLFERILDEKTELFKFYKGKDEEVIEKATKTGQFDGKTEEELDELFSGNASYAYSSALFDYLLDGYEVDVVRRYGGSDKTIFEKMISKGLLTDKNETAFVELLQGKINFARSDELFLAALDKYSTDIIQRYTGNAEAVFIKAVQKGLKVDFSFFEARESFVNSNYLVEEAIKNDRTCAGLKISRLSGNKEEIINTLKLAIGEENYSQVVQSEKIEDEIVNLCTIAGTPLNGVRLVKCMNPELIKALGFDEWKKTIKYSFNNPDLKELIGIIGNDKVSDFVELYGNLNTLINDEKAGGVNKFLKFAGLYNANPELLSKINERIKTGKALTEQELMDFQIVMYGKDENLRKEVTFDDLGKLTERERDKRLARVDSGLGYGLKDDLCTFLFNMSSSEISTMLQKDINTQTVLRILERANKKGNESLSENAQYMYVLVDMLEQISAADLGEKDLREFARKIYESDPAKLNSIRKSFFNLKETVRGFYEKEAQAELTDLQALMNNPDFVEKDGEDLIIDVSHSEHVIYGHVLGTSVSEFFDRDRGKVTICVSPETDMHEAYYYGEGDGIIFGFTEIPKGGFIGSSTQNMGSNGYINENDYNDERVSSQFNQKSIRDSYEEIGGSGHSETLLYRSNLVPTCIILTRPEPNEAQKNARRELEAIINKGIDPSSPDYKRIPFVRTQRHKNRVYAYQKQLPQDGISLEGGTKQEQRVEELRKKFSSIISLPGDEEIVRKARSGSYVIRDDKVYVLQDNLSPKEVALQKTAAMLQGIVHGDENPKGLDIITVDVKQRNGEPKEVIAIRDIDARNMWNYDRTKGTFLPKTNRGMLQEFLVDHLMCNYAQANNAFLLDVENQVYGVGKESAFGAMNQFMLADGTPYTNMSYLFFDENSGNNIYRRVFESYVKAENPDEVLPQEAFSEFLDAASRISEMDDNEYLEMFEEVFSTIEDAETREKMKTVALARKQNLGTDSRQFVQRLQDLREAEHTPDVYKTADSIAFVNDVHGNAEALKAIFDECRRTGKKDVYILGDMIGFGPQTNECLDLIREQAQTGDLSIKCILGNHELYSLMGNKSFIGKSNGFEPENTSRVRKELTEENRRFIESLPVTRKLEIGGKTVELTHFPIKKDYTEDVHMYMGHGSGFSKSSVDMSGQEYIIYGHEHRTEATRGDAVGTIDTIDVEGTKFINLPSSGCVHGKKTSFVSLSLETKDGATVLAPTVETVEYDRMKLQEVLISTNNPKAHFFGLTQDSLSGGEDVEK